VIVFRENLGRQERRRVLKRDFTRLLDITEAEGRHLLERARVLKKLRRNKEEYKPLKDAALGMIFEKASTRTRISFEIGIKELGGYGIFLSAAETQMGRGEPVKDTARVLSRYLNAIMIRTFLQETVEELARWATIPVINGLSDLYHPCQILSDLLTIEEFKGDINSVKIAYIGDGNNIANSWLEAAILFGLDFALATPEGYQPERELLERARRTGHFFYSTDPFEAAEGADVVNTDVWVSMGQEREQAERRRAFATYRLDETLMGHAKDDAIVMHCLPAHRSEEISEGVFEKFQHVIFEQAENRLHGQKALLEWLLT
jgi:ornithine carbamoyltransferase